MSTIRRSARLAAKQGSEEPEPKSPSKMTPGELRAAFVRLQREFRAAQEEQAARVAAAAAVAEAPKPLCPPDAPPMELVLTIRIPIRFFPAANLEEKNKSIDTIRGFLERFENSTKEQRVLVAVDLYNEMIRQPILVANSVKFRNQATQTLANLSQEIKEQRMHEIYSDAFEEMSFEFHELLGDIHHHPWYTPDE